LPACLIGALVLFVEAGESMVGAGVQMVDAGESMVGPLGDALAAGIAQVHALVAFVDMPFASDGRWVEVGASQFANAHAIVAIAVTRQ
jgi:hypothetical protein